MKQAESYEQQRNTLIGNIAEASAAWFKRCCENPALPQFLFFKPGSLQVAIDAVAPGADWQAASTTPVSCAQTKQDMQRWAFETLRHCPVYPV